MILCSVCHGRLHNCDGGINGYARKTCKICDEPAKSMGYCNAHYKRMRKHGNPYMVIVWIDNKRTLVDEREVKHMKYINHTDGKMIE